MCHHNLFPVLLTFGLLGPLSGCSHKEDLSSAPTEPVVRVGFPIERKVTDYEYFTGRTDAVDHVEVRARVSGYLDKINFEAGSGVKKDQVLFVIDPRPYKAEADLAKSQVKLREASLKLATANLSRGLEISKTKGAISQQDLDKLAAEEAGADAAVKSAKSKVDLAELNLKFTEVTSPVDGIAGRNLLSLGNLVAQDNTLLSTIVSMDPMYAYFDVDERTMLRVQKLLREGKIKSAKDGVLVEFGLANEDDDYPHKGHVDFVNNEVDIATGTIQVRGVLPNPPAGKDHKGNARFVLTPGLFVRVRLPVGEPHQALLVPQAALGTDQGKKFLYVVNDKNVVEYRPVVPAAQQPGGLQVVQPVKMKRTKNGVEQEADSIAPGDQIIVGGLQRVRTGAKVKTKAAAEAAK